MSSFFRPEDQRGFTYQRFTGVLAAYKYEMWGKGGIDSKTGEKYGPSCSAKLIFIADDGNFVVNEHVTLGKGFEPSADGTSLVPDKENEGKGIHRSSNLAYFVRELLAKGVPEDRIPTEEDGDPYSLQWAMGVRGTWEQKLPTPKARMKVTVLDEFEEILDEIPEVPKKTTAQKRTAAKASATKRTKPVAVKTAGSNGQLDSTKAAEEILAKIVEGLDKPMTLSQLKNAAFREAAVRRDEIDEETRTEMLALIVTPDFLATRTNYDVSEKTINPSDE